jgi:hypothetical protein
LGPDHPDTLASLHNLAIAEWEQGNLARAREQFERLLDSQVRRFGNDHPDAQRSRRMIDLIGEPAAKNGGAPHGDPRA